MQIPKERMTLVSDEAADLFGGATSIDSDYSLPAFVRAIALKYGQFPLDQIKSVTQVSKYRVRSLDDMQYCLDEQNEAIIIVECINCIDEPIFEEGWVSEYSVNGRQFLPSRYLSQFCKTKILINQEEKRVVAFVDRRATHVWVQAFESIIARLMPWYFPSDLSDEEKRLFTTISEAGGKIAMEEAENVFVDFVNSVAKDIDFRQIRLHKQLDGIANRLIQSKITQIRMERDDYLRYITEYQAALRGHYANYEKAVAELAALELAPASTDTSMFDFFNNHKQLSVLDVDDNLRFGVADTLEFYDEDGFTRVAQNENSYFTGYSESVKKALWGIFKERRGVIRVQAVFDLSGMKLVSPRRRESFRDGYMPNPHIYFFACSGGNDQYYGQYAESGDWDLAIEQAIAATKNVNWGDSVACNRMVGWLRDNSNTPCIYIKNDFEPIDAVDPSMKVVSFSEFMKKMDEQ